MVHLGISQGWLLDKGPDKNDNKKKKKQNTMTVQVQHNTSQRQSMKEANAEISKLFKDGKGSLAVVTHYKLDPRTVFYHDIILAFGAPVEEWSE